MSKPQGKPKNQEIQVSAEILDEIEEHAYSNLVAEVGGMLVGEIIGRKTIIRGAIPALSASAEQISLTFTHEVWDEILQVVDKDFTGQQIVGWYHTHPSFGLFLSQYDSFIQENFFSTPGQLALVLDPIAGTYAWFELNKKREIEMFGQEKTKRGPRAKPGQTSTAATGIKLSTVVAVAGVCALISAAAVWGVMKFSTPPDLTSVVQARGAELESAKMQFQSILSSPVLSYTVQTGDTLSSVAERFYGDPSNAELIAQINKLDPNVELVVGSQILLPHVPGVTVATIPASSFPTTPTPVPTPSPSETESAPSTSTPTATPASN